MPVQLQTFLMTVITKQLDSLIKAVESLPEDKRTWSPEGKGRTALNQAAEIVLMNDSIANVITARAWDPDYSFDKYYADIAELSAKDWSAVKALLLKSTSALTDAILAIPDELLATPVDMPWGPMPLSEIAAYQYYNLSYHDGQINYIGSIA